MKDVTGGSAAPRSVENYPDPLYLWRPAGARWVVRGEGNTSALRWLVLFALCGAFLVALSGQASASTIHAKDTFSRVVSDGWGSGEAGGAYAVYNSASNFSVANGRGNMRLASPGSGNRAILSNNASLNQDIVGTVRTDKKATGYGQLGYFMSRAVAPGTFYDARVRMAGDGSVYLQAVKTVSGKETALGTEVRVANLTHVAGSDIRVRAQFIGKNPTTIRIKAWKAGQVEPACWSYRTTDSEASLQAAGSIGLRGVLSGSSTNAPVSISFDDYQVSEMTGASNWGVGIKDTAYGIPSGAKFVSTCGSDANNGTRSAPWRTIGKAIAASPSGTTVVIHEGTYRESVALNNKKLTLQPFPHEKVWMNGSEIVTGWQTDGNAWRKDNWNYKFRRDGAPSNYISSSHPLADYPDMVFINGQALKQVANRSQVTTGTFFADYANNRLYIGSSPYNKTVEAAARAQALILNQAGGSVVRGIGFAQYATHPDQHGMVQNNSPGITFENNTFVRGAASGLGIFSTDAIVRGNELSYNGQMGVQGHNAHRMLVENNVFKLNNQERFAVTGSAGGMKVTASNGNVWRNNLAEGNLGHGLWADIDTYDTDITNNTVRSNENNGIVYEISSKAIIASNLVLDNGWNGIFLNESRGLSVYNNTLSGNAQNVRVWEGLRSYNVANVTVRNNVMQGGGEKGLFGVVAQENRVSAAGMGVTADHNAYYRKSASSPNIVSEWAARAGSVARYETLSAFRSGSGQEGSAVGSDNTQSNPQFVNESQGNFSLRSSSSSIGNGAPLPYDVAVAIGVQPNVTVNRGKL